MASPKQLFTDINSGKFKPVYYFFGHEEYRVTEARKYLVSRFLPDLQQAGNHIRIDGRKTSTANLLAELAALPMLGDRQVFSISDIQSYKPTEREKIFKIINPPDPNRIIIFSTPAQRTPKKNSAFYKSILKSAEIVEFQKLTMAESAAQITAKLKREEINIEPDAIRLLSQILAGNRGALEGELNKLINFKNKGETVSLDDIQKVSSGYEVYNIFNLADRIISGNSYLVLKMIRSLFSEGVSAIALVTLLQQHFISIYLVKNHKNPVGNRAFLIPNFRVQGEKFSNQQLEKYIIEIARLDSELRQNRMKPEQAMEILALKISSGN